MNTTDSRERTAVLGLHFGAVVDRLAAGVMTIGPAGCILHANPLAAELVGTTVEELRGTCIEDVIPDLAQATEGLAIGPNLHLKKENGTQLAIDLDCQRLTGEGEEFSILTFSLAAEWPKSGRPVAPVERDEPLEKLVAAVAHDFNNLLTVISYCGDELRMELEEDDLRREHVDELTAATVRASELARRLLDLGCRDSVAAETVELSTTTLTRGAAAGGCPEEDVTPVDSARSGDEPSVVLVVEDEDLVRRVTAAVLRREGFEVLEAKDAEEALSLTESTRDELALVVTDVGLPGMSGVELAESLGAGQASLPVVFVSGRPADSELAGWSAGHARAFLQKPFRPVELTTTVSALGLPIPGKPNRASHASILVIDDEEQVRRILCRMLEDAGFEAHGVSNGLEGVEYVRESKCDLVITDVVMPVQEGLETCRALAAEFPSLPVIATSGAACGSTYLRMADRFGARETLAKPLHKDELVAAVRRTLR